MAEMEDFEFRPAEESGTYPIDEATEESDGTRSIVVVAVLLVVALAAGGYVLYQAFFSSAAAPPPVEVENPLPPPPPPPVAADPEPPAAEPEPFVLPDLDRSDGAVRTLVASLSSHPRLARWLATDELIRRSTRIIANIAYGESPRAHLALLRPDGEFKVVERDGTLRIDTRSYDRYDLVTQVFLSLDVEGTASLYRQLSPLLEQAYAELGYPERSFDAMLRRAIDELLSVPQVDPRAELTLRVITYDFADPDLQALSDPQRQLLRMGPDNVLRIQGKLRQLRQAIS